MKRMSSRTEKGNAPKRCFLSCGLFPACLGFSVQSKKITDVHRRAPTCTLPKTRVVTFLPVHIPLLHFTLFLIRILSIHGSSCADASIAMQLSKSGTIEQERRRIERNIVSPFPIVLCKRGFKFYIAFGLCVWV